METVSASVARQTFTAQLDKVAAGEQVTITRHGRVVAVLVAPEVLYRERNPELWAAADRIGEALTEARKEPMRGAALSATRAEELSRGVREERGLQ